MSSSEIRDSSKQVSNRISSKVWYFITYPESSDIKDVITNACFGGFDYAIMFHDSDVEKDGTPKKPHYHVAVWRPRTATLKQIKDLFEIQYAERPRYGSSLGDYITYMTHEKEPHKHQYSIDLLQSNVPRETIDRLLSSNLGCVENSTEEVLNDIFALMQGDITYRDFYLAHPRFLYNPRALDTLMRQLNMNWQAEVSNSDGTRFTSHEYTQPHYINNQEENKQV